MTVTAGRFLYSFKAKPLWNKRDSHTQYRFLRKVWETCELVFLLLHFLALADGGVGRVIGGRIRPLLILHLSDTPWLHGMISQYRPGVLANLMTLYFRLTWHSVCWGLDVEAGILTLNASLELRLGTRVHMCHDSWPVLEQNALVCIIPQDPIQEQHHWINANSSHIWVYTLASDSLSSHCQD